MGEVCAASSPALRFLLALGLLLSLQSCAAMMAAGAIDGGDGYRASQHRKVG